MKHLSNEAVVKSLYRDFAENDMKAALAAFDPHAVFVRPGEGDIPFSGTFAGMEKVVEMFAVTNDCIDVKKFVPSKFCSVDDLVIVLGHDEAAVRKTGKAYKTDWVQLFTLKNGKITRVQVYMDTLAIFKAFQP